MGRFFSNRLYPNSSSERGTISTSASTEGCGSSGIHGSEEIVLPMGHIPDLTKASDGELNAELAHCRAFISLIEQSIRDNIEVETNVAFRLDVVKCRLSLAEEELERRFLLS